MPSPFSRIPPSDWIASNDLAFAIFDRHRVSPGHALIIPRREVPTWFDASPAEHLAILALVDQIKALLDANEPRPDGYNVGFNAGEAAGQTIMHLHVHVIPRYRGDMPDPRGGVRHVIPWKGNYLREAHPPLSAGGPEDPFLRHLRPLFDRAERISIVAAFVRNTGLDLLARPVLAALRRGAQLRLLTGDYLRITEVDALGRLLLWMQGTVPVDDEPHSHEGKLEVNVVETELLPQRARSFHPKSWIFQGADLAVAFVGSSNVSFSALDAGIEWNLRTDGLTHPEPFSRILTEFDALFQRAVPLTQTWLDGYAARVAARPPLLPLDELDPPAPPCAPHEFQLAALAALAEARAVGRDRALVVLATGLGKTALAALDVAEFASEHGALPRVLFLAHRAELLSQAADSFRARLRERGHRPRASFYIGDQTDLSGRLVFASVQKLGRKEHLQRLSGQPFDYVIIDEVHHATAPSYRAILRVLSPRFLLGLTATPDRPDGEDVRDLFNEPVYRADLAQGIDSGLLCPFSYFGLKDSVNYEADHIPWRNHRFDPAALARAVQTQERMRQMFTAWTEHPGARTLLFCCSTEHANFVRDWLRDQGVRCEAVHSDPSSADREQALVDLDSGRLDAVCSVDMFNEGIDLPAIDRVVLLRPTESLIIFLQQIGRGLRRAARKAHLTIIDFVGNHKIFLERLRTLLSLGAQPTPLEPFLKGQREAILPPGCSIELETEAKDLLSLMNQRNRRQYTEEAYADAFADRGARPSAADLLSLGYDPVDLRREERDGKRYWFEFVQGKGHLTATEEAALVQAEAWLHELEQAEMTKSFKMVLLLALLEADALRTGLPLDELAGRSLKVLQRRGLMSETEGVKALEGMNWSRPDEERWARYWRGNPVRAWQAPKAGRAAWFEVQEDRLVSKLPPVPQAISGTLEAMTQELVEYRLARYRRDRLLGKVETPVREAAVTASRPVRATWSPRRMQLVRSYPDLRAAAGVIDGSVPPQDAGDLLEQAVALPVYRGGNQSSAFAVRADGNSMMGGNEPIRHGDWLVMKRLEGSGLAAVSGRIALLQIPDRHGDVSFQVKRVVQHGKDWLLRSENPAYPTFPVVPGVAPVAVVLETIRPESLAPPPGSEIDDYRLAETFGLQSLPMQTGRAGGHLFLLLDGPGTLVPPDGARCPIAKLRPGESAFVLLPLADKRWRYLGVGRFDSAAGLWRGVLQP